MGIEHVPRNVLNIMSTISSLESASNNFCGRNCDAHHFFQIGYHKHMRSDVAKSPILAIVSNFRAP